jgi:endonuclease YncB( thermonuclease family)
MLRRVSLLPLLMLALAALACTFGFDPNAPSIITPGSGGNMPAGEDAIVTRIVDGDTINVTINGQDFSVRYVGINTPERDEACFSEATQANAFLVQGKTVRLVRDISNTDRFGRLLRYIWVNGVHVNQVLIEQGFAEVVLYEPDRAYYDTFRRLEGEARAANRGCHPSGIFNDGSDTR